MKTMLNFAMFMMLLIQSGAFLNAQTSGDTDKKTTATENNLKPQTECPVLGGAVDKSLFVDYQGKRIYVCCAGCIDTVKSDPEKFIKKLADKGEYAIDIPKE